MRVGGPAELFVDATDERAVKGALDVARDLGVHLRFLGAGSNLLVADAGVPGIVVRMTGALSRAAVRGRTLWCQGGFPLARAISISVRAALDGLAELAGIPATVGGAVAMNAGTKHAAIAERLAWVRFMTRDGRVDEVPAARLSMRYRDGAIGDRAVLGVAFDLAPGDEATLRARHRIMLDEKRRTQPLQAATAGCFFKNPPGAHARELIAEAGLVGAREGGARVSAVHPNFLVNDGTASACDVDRLATRVRDVVEARTRVALEREVRSWGTAPTDGGAS